MSNSPKNASEHAKYNNKNTNFENISGLFVNENLLRNRGGKAKGTIPIGPITPYLDVRIKLKNPACIHNLATDIDPFECHKEFKRPFYTLCASNDNTNSFLGF